MLPKISIVTPSYNQGEYIEETICSVLDQKYPNLEYVIVDGGSTDKTVEIIKKYQKHLKYWVSEPDSGQSNAINKGLKYCTGDIFNWLNSDDLLYPGSLHIVSDYFRTEDIEIVTGNEIHFDSSTDAVKSGSIIYEDVETNLFSGVIYQPSTFWKMSVLRPYLPVNEELHYLMDTHLWISYILTHGTLKIRKINDILAKFRLHAESKSVTSVEEFRKERWSLRKELLSSLGPLPRTIDNVIAAKVSSNVHDIVQPPCKVDVNKDKLLKLCLDELCLEAYVTYNYSELKKLLIHSLRRFHISKSIIGYFFRIYLVPKGLLSILRK